MSEGISFVWIRRDMRLHDHACLHAALKSRGAIQPVFVFDTDILARFSHKKDRRLSFLAHRLCVLDEQLKQRGGGMLILHGRAQEIIPKLASVLSVQQVVAAEDFEPATRKRDQAVKESLPDPCRFVQPLDHLIHAPYAVTKEDGNPYKVFTPYSRRWREQLNTNTYAVLTVEDKGRYAEITSVRRQCRDAGVSVLDPSHGADEMLKAIGYEPVGLGEWNVEESHVDQRLQHFVDTRIKDYKDARNMLAEPGTSKLSPYLRFGLISVRECARKAEEIGGKGADVWINELIWRDFYAMILYHFPQVVEQEFQEQYRGMDWSNKSDYVQAFKDGRTGYPAVDAAMRELNTTGWMHNRARMIVASFATKHLDMDWRIGEEYFAQTLMDYDLASNNGGWQWAASTGTDAQPYFRVFNPWTQGEKFDPKGEYIRRYVEELRDVEDKFIHAPYKMGMLKPAHYPEPIVEHKPAREAAIGKFKEFRK